MLKGFWVIKQFAEKKGSTPETVMIPQVSSRLLDESKRGREAMFLKVEISVLEIKTQHLVDEMQKEETGRIKIF